MIILPNEKDISVTVSLMAKDVQLLKVLIEQFMICPFNSNLVDIYQIIFETLDDQLRVTINNYRNNL